MKRKLCFIFLLTCILDKGDILFKENMEGIKMFNKFQQSFKEFRNFIKSDLLSKNNEDLKTKTIS